MNTLQQKVKPQQYAHIFLHPENLNMQCLKFTITIKLSKRVKMLEGDIDNSIENSEGVCQY